MRPLRSTLLTLTLLLPLGGHAAAIATGQPLPPLQIDELGECVLRGDDTAFVPWRSDSLSGKVQVVEYMAARAGIDKIQQPLYAAINAAALPADRLALVKLVNADDALFGTGALVAPEIGKNKRLRTDETLVVDAEGVGRQRWQLQPKGSAVAIVDATGTVLFFKEGALTADEVAQAVTLLRQQLQ